MKIYISGFKFSQLEMSQSLCYNLYVELGFLIFAISTEVVLSLLIESLEFAPSKKEIFWQMTVVATPIVVSEGTRPKLPLLVKLAKSGS